MSRHGFLPPHIQSGVTTYLQGGPSTCAGTSITQLWFGLDSPLLRKTLWLATKIDVYGPEHRPTLGPTLSENCGMREVIIVFGPCNHILLLDQSQQGSKHPLERIR